MVAVSSQSLREQIAKICDYMLFQTVDKPPAWLFDAIRDALQAADHLALLEQRNKALRSAAEGAVAFLDSVEWSDSTSEFDAADTQHALEAALLEPPHQEKREETTIMESCSTTEVPEAADGGVKTHSAPYGVQDIAAIAWRCIKECEGHQPPPVMCVKHQLEAEALQPRETRAEVKIGVIEFHSNEALREDFYRVADGTVGFIVDVWLLDIQAVLRNHGYDMRVYRLPAPPVTGGEPVPAESPEALALAIAGRAYATTPSVRHLVQVWYAALKSIAANSCCQPCREAALVAQKALR